MRTICPLAGLAALLAWSGCASKSYHASALAPATTAEAFDSRSLDDAGLRRFLTENLQQTFSARPATWNFETLAWVAFYYHPALNVARAQWEVARASQQTATARPNPTLTLTPGYDTNAPAGVSPWLPAVGADFTLSSTRERDLRAAAAQYEANAAQAAVSSAVWNVRSELRQALIRWKYAQERTAMLHNQTALNRAVLSVLEIRYETGVIEASAVSTARLAVVRAETLSAEAASQLPVAQQRVAAALGIPATALEGVQLEDAALPVAPWTSERIATARRQALQARSDVLAMLARYQAADAALALEVARQHPSFHLGPGYQWDQGENKWTLGLSLELPLFNHNEGPIAEAEARRREAAAQFVATQTAAIAEIDAAVAEQAGRMAQLDHWRQARNELRHAVALTQARFDAGAADQLEVQNSRLELATGESAMLDAEKETVLAAGRLEDVLQIPFPNLATLTPQARDPAPASLP